MSATVPAPAPTVPRISRNAAIVGSVVLAHGVGLWALNNGLLQRAIEVVVPAEILAERDGVEIAGDRHGAREAGRRGDGDQVQHGIA